uniref:MULE transposase domain-containing protein n=1 Tax=Gossypium raimondii TaxID=29730 RepID=A0A0D2PU40_GOSRA|nr:hypothetical protein B456_005G166100 [Gossypium raimondii]
MKRTVQLYSIKRHQNYEVVEAKKQVPALRCKRHFNNGCKRRLRAYQCKYNALLEISQYDGTRTCVYLRLSRDHPYCKILVEAFGVFHCVFWAFPRSIGGFKYCRPFTSIDTTYLYGRYKGKMLIGMEVDANNQLFPLAFAIVKEESFDSYDIPVRKWTLTHDSSRHYGIMTINLPKVFPCSHVMVVRGRLALDNWQYIENYYSIEHYFQTWASQFNPIPHEIYWPERNIPQLLLDPACKKVQM